MINEETLLSSNQTLLSILFQVKIIYRYFEDEIFFNFKFRRRRKTARHTDGYSTSQNC